MEIFLFLILLMVRVALVEGKAYQILGRQASSSASGVATGTTSSVFSIPTNGPAPSVNGSEHDLSKHFCRLWRHQSVLADGKIYVDGGNTYIPDNNLTFNTVPSGSFEQGMNDIILVLDLSSNFTNQDTTPYSVIDKPPQVPNAIIEGILWFSNNTRKIYQLGGWFSFNNVADPAYIQDVNLPNATIWEYDIDQQTWDMLNYTGINTGDKVQRIGAAANCGSGMQGEGNLSWGFEGYLQRRSDWDTRNFTVSSEFKFIEGMIQLDTSTIPPALTNISVPNYMGPRMNGAMIHIPVGPKGVLVQIAGQTTMIPTSFGVGIENANAGNVNINNTVVDIYDIQTGYWFRQQTFGVPDIPTGRSDICTVLVAAQDGSSYNIFMIAGVETYNSVIVYEDIWVLSIPTFQWVKVHTRPGGIYGHTCHLVGENLLVIGGMQTTDSGGNVRNCSDHMPAEIFSLVDMEYTGQFDAAGAKRPPPVPPDVVKLIGGTSSGGAVVTRPVLWSDLYLQYVFNPSLTRPAYTPTYTLANITLPQNTTFPTPSPISVSSKRPVGAIVGSVVGGIAFISILAIFPTLCLRKRRNSLNQSRAAERENPFLPPIDREPDISTKSEAELPSYTENKLKLVLPEQEIAEVSSFQNPLIFTPYVPRNEGRNGIAEIDGQELRDGLGELESPVTGRGGSGSERGSVSVSVISARGSLSEGFPSPPLPSPGGLESVSESAGEGDTGRSKPSHVRSFSEASAVGSSGNGARRMSRQSAVSEVSR